MIRTVAIPLGRARMGAASIGSGGNAGNYQFSNGLSSDPALPPYLQNLTPAQLQTALDGGDPTAALLSQLGQDSSATLTTCQQNYDPTICGPGGPNSTNPLAMSLGLSSNGIFGAVPSWALIAGAAVAGIAILGAIRR